MKKIMLTALIAVIVMVQVNAQSTFGATAGYLSADSKFEDSGSDFSASESGFYIGMIADFEISETFYIQPELLYVNVNDISFMQLPIMAKIYVADRFSLQVGPQITYTLEDVFGDFTKFNIGLGLGFAYDFSDQFFIESRYTYQINNYYTGDLDITSRINFLNVGLGYKFN